MQSYKPSLWLRLFAVFATLMVALAFMLPQPVDAAGTTSSSSSSASSSSSSTSSASRASSSTTSSSSTSSMSRQSAINASRQSAQQASQSASRQASQNSLSRSQAQNQASRNSQKSAMPKNNNTLSRSQAKGQAKYKNMQGNTRSLTPVGKPYSSGAPYDRQFMTTSFYNNWLIYSLLVNQNETKKNKIIDIDKQKDILKSKMKDNEKLYTVTINTKKGKRLITLPKKDYDKVQKGAKVKYHNGQLDVA